MKMIETDVPSPEELRPSLRKLADEIRKGCTSCDICLHDCAFLRKHGNPGRIADAYSPTDKESRALPFECNLCGLCSSVCPERLDLNTLFLEMRREAVDRDGGGFPEHNVIINYEKTGTSRRFSLYRLPEGCDTVFFPGCALAGTRPDGVRKVFDSLQRTIPHLGIVFDCCLKPSHDLGREAYFTAMFNEMRDYLVGQGIKTVLTACPNCQLMFGTYGDGLTTSTIYEALAAGDTPVGRVSGTVTIHDPCSIRGFAEVHAAVRDLLGRTGLTIEEMPHSGTSAICCGEGGAVAFLAPELAEGWRNLRHSEADGRKMVTYCAACAAVLGKRGSCSHVIDILFDAENALAGKAKVSKAPFTYLNRLLLKREFKRKAGSALLRERTFAAGDETRKSGMKPLILAVVLVAAIAAVHFSGASRYLEQEKLRELIQGYGVLAPALYMLIYALAPVFFLPGLPITIVGGILFGPFWGVVYTITGATIGASLAFLVARYLARDWIEDKLTSPRWRRLDREVETHGWKVVAFTRLIPAFPFNLLNYAFGLTRIPFLHYAVATFFCMLPACIAFIVFSSSLPGLIRGKVSPTLLIGILLVALVSLLPVAYRRIKARRELRAAPEENPSP
jgi:uncharacterized membrane protein YdjX (TVP38/TMEM64 family)/Fe-S oxidoreductase